MIALALFLLLPSAVSAMSETLPEWFIPLRDAVYEQRLTADEISPLFRDVSAKAKTSLSGDSLHIMLSRCEYMMGRAYQYEERKSEAAARYDEGINKEKKALETNPSAESWQMLAENISQSCAVRSVSYAMANGLKVEKYAKNALAINGRNAAARIMTAARWVYAPAPFHNYNKGIEMMTAALNESDMEKDDLFNAYLGLGYAHIQQKKDALARPWLLKSLELYPTNKYARALLGNLR
jgi:tetratricopeptide (TPR) repeat protein